jgi:uncharacterized protein
VLAENIVHFARILRTAGMPIGPDRVLAAMAAIECVGLNRRDDVHAALSAVMIDRHEQQVLFDAAFEAFWRDPKLLEQLMYLLLPKISGRGEKQNTPRANRLAEALAPPRPKQPPNPANNSAPEELKFDTTFTFSERERLQQAERASHGRLDLRATMQRMARQPHTLTPMFTRPRKELPTLVVLLDISGSMERYARLLLHYVHGLTRRYLKVHTFTFGTRLSNITRSLRHRDPDVALLHADRVVQDWKGGTRIASCLAEFNHDWGRRLLGSSAAVLLMTDGLDRDEHGDLAKAAAQLRRTAHTIVWLNPLLRFDGFEPRAAGVRALLPNVDRFLPVHNLASLADLGRALRAPAVNPSSLLN